MLDLEASFDSGVGGGDAREYKHSPKNFDSSKIREKYLKIQNNSANFSHRCFDTFALIV